MIYTLVSVKDLKTGFLPLTYSVNDEAAMRDFKVACDNAKGTTFFKFPSDYQLWHVGTFDTETGEVEKDLYFLMDAPQHFDEERNDANEIQDDSRS